MVVVLYSNLSFWIIKLENDGGWAVHSWLDMLIYFVKYLNFLCLVVMALNVNDWTNWNDITLSFVIVWVAAKALGDRGFIFLLNGLILHCDAFGNS